MSRKAQAVAGASHGSASAVLLSGRPSASLVVLPLVALVAVVLFELATWDRITPGVSALGTPLGGLSRSEAIQRLTPSVQQVLERPLTISVPSVNTTWSTSARDLGMRLDAEGLADAAYRVGRDGGPFTRLVDQFDVVAYGRSVSVDNSTDRDALDAALGRMAQQVNRPPTDARLSLAGDGSIQSSSANAGLSVDIAASREQLTSALDGGLQSVALVTIAVPPTVTDDQLQTARDELMHLVGPDAQPLTLTYADQTWQLERADLARLVSLADPRPGQPAAVQIDDKALRGWATRVAADVDQSVQDARFAFNGGNLKVLRPSHQGRTVDQDALVRSVHDALLSGSQTIPLPVSTVDPSVSSEDPQSLGITEVIDRGSTSFAGSIPEKKHNIQLAAQRLNGIVVPPGATFSFNAAVGPTTTDAGFEWGFGIASGNDGPRTVPSVAGGICQVATTLFQPVFWSGYQLEERYWHMYWIPAYTSRGVVGLDVTVDSDAGLDFKWTNTTSNYILIQSDADDANIYFGLYGKKPPWKVAVDDAIITNRTPPDPRPIAEEEPTMAWGRTLLVETARDGFDAEVVRHVIPSDGGKSRDLDLKSSYQPARTVTLVGSKGKPAGSSIDAAIQRVLDAQKTPEPRPSPTPGSATSTTATPAAPRPTAAPQTAQQNGIAATPTAAPRNQPSAPTPRPQATSKPASNAIAPTPVPAH